jgi:hypothetical protein
VDWTKPPLAILLISQPRDFFFLYFQTILAVTVQETNRYVQQDAQARNKPDVTYSQQVNVKDLYAFLADIVQMGHDHRPSMKLCWTTDELYCVPFYFSVMSRDRFRTILKYFADNQNPRKQNREDSD